MKKLIALVLGMMLVLGCLGLIGCGGGKKEEAGTGTTAEVEKDKEEKSRGGGKGWKDVAMYKGAEKSQQEVKMNIPAAAQGEYESTERRSYETQDEPEKVHEYYLEQMSKKGWHKLFAMKYPEGSAVSAWIKDDGARSCVVSTGKLKDGMTFIGLMLNEGKK